MVPLYSGNLLAYISRLLILKRMSSTGKPRLPPPSVHHRDMLRKMLGGHHQCHSGSWWWLHGPDLLPMSKATPLYMQAQCFHSCALPSQLFAQPAVCKCVRITPCSRQLALRPPLHWAPRCLGSNVPFLPPAQEHATCFFSSSTCERPLNNTSSLTPTLHTCVS